MPFCSHFLPRRFAAVERTRGKFSPSPTTPPALSPTNTAPICRDKSFWCRAEFILPRMRGKFWGKCGNRAQLFWGSGENFSPCASPKTCLVQAYFFAFWGSGETFFYCTTCQIFFLPKVPVHTLSFFFERGISIGILLPPFSPK